jgi:hypothetical protein
MIRSGDWKLINQLGCGGLSKPSSINPGPGEPAGQLYNLREDLAETNNLYLKHPEIVVKLELGNEAYCENRTQPRKYGAAPSGAGEPWQTLSNRYEGHVPTPHCS